MAKQIDYLTLEVGSFLTKASGFVKTKDNCLEFVGKGVSPTTLSKGNIGLGVFTAIEDLEKRSSFATDKCEVYASCSVSGGLRFSVHGISENTVAEIVYFLNVGIGCRVDLATVGNLSEYDIDEIEEAMPDFIILVGNDDASSKEILLSNALKLSSMDIGTPIIFIGIDLIKRAVENIFHRTGIEIISITNFYQSDKTINFTELLNIVKKNLENKFIEGPGIKNLRRISNHPLVSNINAVAKADVLFSERLGTSIIADIGANSFAIHSPSFNRNNNVIFDFEGVLTTLDSDLGLIYNLYKCNLDLIYNNDTLMSEINSETKLEELVAISFEQALIRHNERALYDKNKMNLECLIITGGFSKNLKRKPSIIKNLITKNLKNNNLRLLFDENYLVSSLGLIGIYNPNLIKNTINNWNTNNVELFTI